MTISSVTPNNRFNTNFKRYNPYYNGNLVCVRNFPDYEERVYETPAPTGKKWGVGLASFVCSGFGQAINGDWGKGVGFFAGSLFSLIAGNFFAISGKIIPTLAMFGLYTGIKIWSIADAVKGAKEKVTQFIPKNSNSQKQYKSFNA